MNPIPIWAPFAYNGHERNLTTVTIELNWVDGPVSIIYSYSPNECPRFLQLLQSALRIHCSYFVPKKPESPFLLQLIDLV